MMRIKTTTSLKLQLSQLSALLFLAVCPLVAQASIKSADFTTVSGCERRKIDPLVLRATLTLSNGSEKQPESSDILCWDKTNHMSGGYDDGFFTVNPELSYQGNNWWKLGNTGYAIEIKLIGLRTIPIIGGDATPKPLIQIIQPNTRIMDSSLSHRLGVKLKYKLVQWDKTNDEILQNTSPSTITLGTVTASRPYETSSFPIVLQLNSLAAPEMTCQPIQQSQHVKLKTLKTGELAQNAYTLGAAFDLGVQNCPPGLSVYHNMEDVNNPPNKSIYLTTLRNGTAQENLVFMIYNPAAGNWSDFNSNNQISIGATSSTGEAKKAYHVYWYRPQYTGQYLAGKYNAKIRVNYYYD